MAVLLQTHQAPEIQCMSSAQEWNSPTLTVSSDRPHAVVSERASVKQLIVSENKFLPDSRSRLAYMQVQCSYVSFSQKIAVDRQTPSCAIHAGFNVTARVTKIMVPAPQVRPRWKRHFIAAVQLLYGSIIASSKLQCPLENKNNCHLL